MLLLVLPFSLLFWVLWLYWLQQHDALRERAGLAPLSPSDCSQFHARCFRQASTRTSAALAKATVMRLTGAP